MKRRSLRAIRACPASLRPEAPQAFDLQCNVAETSETSRVGGAKAKRRTARFRKTIDTQAHGPCYQDTRNQQLHPTPTRTKLTRDRVCKKKQSI